MSETDSAVGNGGARARWRELAEKALKGEPVESLASETVDGLPIAPIYFAGDAPTLGTIAGRSSQIDVRAICAETDAEAANRAILAELEGGATSVTLQLAGNGQPGLAPAQDAISAALEGVDLQLAQVWLAPGEGFEPAAAALDAVWRERSIGEDARGGYGADPLGALAGTGALDCSISESMDKMAALAARTFRTRPKVRAVTADASIYHDAGASEAGELACLGATFIAYLRAMDEGRLTPEDAFDMTAFTLAVDADLLLSIAKLRAARLLLARIAEAADADTQPVWIEAATSRRMMTRYDPYTNMLRMTIASAAAIMGGADAVIVRPHMATAGALDDFARRIARNIPIVLQQEAHLAKVADPAAGSYALDSLTAELAEQAWARLREIEAAGGMAAALQSGSIQARIRETADKRAEEIAAGEIKLIGINAFAQSEEEAPEPETSPRPTAPNNPAVTVEALPLRRLAADLERRRDSELSDRTSARTAS